MVRTVHFKWMQRKCIAVPEVQWEGFGSGMGTICGLAVDLVRSYMRHFEAEVSNVHPRLFVWVCSCVGLSLIVLD